MRRVESIEGSIEIAELDRRRGEYLGGQLDAIEFFALLCLRHRATAELLDASAREAVALAAFAHLLVLSKPGAGYVFQSVFLAAVDGEVVVAALAGVDKLQVGVFANAFEIAVVPNLEWKRGSLAAAFFTGP